MLLKALLTSESSWMEPDIEPDKGSHLTTMDTATVKKKLVVSLQGNVMTGMALANGNFLVL